MEADDIKVRFSADAVYQLAASPVASEESLERHPERERENKACIQTGKIKVIYNTLHQNKMLDRVHKYIDMRKLKLC